MAKVVVVGSVNTDMVARAERLPRPGETVGGAAFAMVPGGKGANQAVAAARLGADVTFIARVGADALGEEAVRGLDAEGIHTGFISRDPTLPTGVALITVDRGTGENCITVAPGANAGLSVALVENAAAAIRSADVLVCQFESPLDAVRAALEIAHAAGCVTLLNPAPPPASPLPDELLALVSVLTPNETEAALLAGAGAATPPQRANALRAQGAASVVVTLGAKGALVVTETQEKWIPPFAPAQVVDTTAAGDCFTGALAVALAESRSLPDAALFAAAAASLSVEAAGAQPSLPTRAAAERRMRD